MVVPFRWNLKKSESLGRLVAVKPPSPSLLVAIRRISAKIIAYSDNGLLAFVGRSPEPFFDYLSGIFFRTSWDERCVLLNVSMYYETVVSLLRKHPAALTAIQTHLHRSGLLPIHILGRRNPTTFVDLVCSGGRWET